MLFAIAINIKFGFFNNVKTNIIECKLIRLVINELDFVIF